MGLPYTPTTLSLCFVFLILVSIELWFSLSSASRNAMYFPVELIRPKFLALDTPPLAFAYVLIRLSLSAQSFAISSVLSVEPSSIIINSKFLGRWQIAYVYLHDYGIGFRWDHRLPELKETRKGELKFVIRNRGRPNSIHPLKDINSNLGKVKTRFVIPNLF